MSMKFELSFVFFDQQGEPHAPGELDDPVKRELLPVLYKDGEWQGPLWKRDGQNNLVPVDSNELVRMHWYAYDEEIPACETSRLATSKETIKMYTDLDGKKKPVPEVDGVSVFNIAMR